MRPVRTIFALLLVYAAMGGLDARPAFAEDLPLIGAKEGELYPDFLLPTLDGKLDRLSAYHGKHGKKILLFHFASW